MKHHELFRLALAAAMMMGLASLSGCVGSTDLPAPGLLLSDNAAVRSETEMAGLGAIDTVVFEGCAQLQPDDLLVAGRSAAVVLRDGAEIHRVAYHEELSDVLVIDLDRDGICEFVGRGGDWSPTSVLEADGRVRLTYRPRGLSSLDVMTPADLDGDGRFEFLVGMNGRGGLRALDHEGHEQWRRAAGNVFSVEVLEMTGEDPPEIVHSDAGQGATMRSLEGDVLGHLGFLRGSFGLLITSDETKAPRFTTFASTKGVDQVFVFDRGGREEVRLALPDRGHLAGDVALVQLGGEPRFAAARTLSATGSRSALYLFALDGTLLHHEIFEAPFVSLSLSHDPDHAGRLGRPALVVGTTDRLVFFSG